MSYSPGFALYLGFSRLSEGFAEKHLKKRLARGREDAARLPERLGHPGRDRPQGTLIWLHAASVGESLSVLEVIRRINAEYPTITVLVTTGTVTSAELMRKRLVGLNAFHQFAPVDSLPVIERFLAHWKPDLAIWTESEFWPATLHALKVQKVPIVLINARLSEKSARNWRWHPLFSRSLLRRFDLLLTQDKITAQRLLALGARPKSVHVTGSLKEGSAPLPHDPQLRKQFSKALEGRSVWLAASTHPGEEEIMSIAHREVRRQHPGACLILAPRHPDRGDEVFDLLNAQGWRIARRSAGEIPDADTDIYLADSLGEMGLWYRLAPVSVVCGSFTPIGGHNPYEPAALGSAIISGPFTLNFQAIFDKLAQAKAARVLSATEELAPAIADLLHPEHAADMATKAWDMQSAGAQITDTVMAHLLPFLTDEAERT